MPDELLRQLYHTLVEARGQAYHAWLDTRPMGSPEEEAAFEWYSEVVATLKEYGAWLEKEKGPLLTYLRAGRQ